MKAKRYILIMILSSVLFGCPSMRPKYLPRPEEIMAQGTYIHAVSGMTLPPSVGDFKRNKLLRYDAENLDMSAGYDLATVAGSVSGTIYVYPAPRLLSIGSPPNVVAAARERLAQNEYEKRKREIMQFRSGTILIQEKVVSFQQTNTGKLAIFEYEDQFAGQRQLLRSYLYMFCYAGDKWVIKYRFTHPKNYDASQEIEAFINNLPWTLTTS